MESFLTIVRSKTSTFRLLEVTFFPEKRKLVCLISTFRVPRRSKSGWRKQDSVDLPKRDVRYTVRDLPRLVYISLARVHGILRKHLKLRKINVRWIPHLLTDEQTRIRVLNAKKLFKMFPKYSKLSLNDLVTGDETWVYYFEPKRQCFNIVLVSKNAVRPSIGKRQGTVKKVLYVIFLDNKGQVMQ